MCFFTSILSLIISLPTCLRTFSLNHVLCHSLLASTRFISSIFLYLCACLLRLAPFPASFSLCTYNFADDWIWSADLCCWKIPLYQLSHTTAQLLYGHYVLTPWLPLSCSISHLNGSTFYYFHRPCTSLPPSLCLPPFVLFFLSYRLFLCFSANLFP